jgi:hypothetical protein
MRLIDPLQFPRPSGLFCVLAVATMFAFSSIFSEVHDSTHTSKPQLPAQSPSTLPIKSTLATAEMCTYAPPLASISLSRNEDKAFDILFAIYHFHFLESEQIYQDWRRPVRIINSSRTILRETLQHGDFQLECSFSAFSDPESETDLSYASTFLSFDSDSDLSSLMSSSSEESLEDMSPATSHIASSNFTGSKTVFVAPAIPPHISVLCRNECGTPAAAYVVDDLDLYENYDARYLTPRARKEAERRSNDIRKMARSIARELEGFIPLKAGEHPAPRNHQSPSALKDLGRSSRLRTCWTIENVEREINQDAMSAQIS